MVTDLSSVESHQLRAKWTIEGVLALVVPAIESQYIDAIQLELSYNFKMGLNGPMLSMNTMTQPAATSNAPYIPLLHAISQQ